MPSTTVNFDLPFPSGDDAPCDFAEQWCTFTQAIDTVFDTFQTAIDRTIPVVPVAIMQMTTANSVFNLNPIPFDTVVVDTAGMTDMDTDPFTITIKRPGRYTVAGGMWKDTNGIFLPVFTAVMVRPTFSAQSYVYDLGSGGGATYYLAAYFAAETYAAGDKIQLTYTTGDSSAHTINIAMLSVLWHADTEVP